MEPMQFWTKSVKHQNDIRVRLSEAGGILMLVCGVLVSVAEKMRYSEEPAAIGALAGLCLLLVGWILRGFKVVRPLVTGTDIMISVNEIRIGDQTFLVDELEYLDFLVNSYEGMAGPRIRWRRITLRGTDNNLYFTAKGKRYSFGFFLEDPIAMRRLEMLFREYYQKGIRFRERNRGGRTFLFEQVRNKEQFERAKREEGYS